MLRGINISGQKVIKMADLKSLYELLGFRNVVTYIQSGNVLFNTTVEKIDNFLTKKRKAMHLFPDPVQSVNGIELLQNRLQ